MGVETPIPPIVMNPAAPDGAPPRRFKNSIPSLNRSAQRGPDDAAKRPRKGVGLLTKSIKKGYQIFIVGSDLFLFMCVSSLPLCLKEAVKTAL